MELLIAALIGLVTGAIGSLVAPWVHWGIEKRRDLRKNRRELILAAREYVESNSFGVSQFAKTNFFAQLKSYLEKNTVDWIENIENREEQVDCSVSDLRENIRSGLLKELHKLEKKWKLI